MIKVTNTQAVRIIGALLILLSGDAFAVRVYATQDGLDTEISNRKSGDSRETARATKAEGTLTTAIATETARAKAAEAAGSFSYSMTCGVSGTDACKIGSVGPGGGWIFFVDYNEQYSGFNYLEAAPTDIASGTKWCYEDTTSIYPTVLTQSQLWAVNGVGYGAANTDAMLLVCSSGAAHDVHAYSSNGKNDWFLGSSGEFMLMYTNLRQAGVGGFEYVYESPAEAPLYWTSTEGGSTSAVTQSFRTGQQGNSNKQYERIVRPMRAF